MMLGRLLELAGDDATVLIVSDHGYRTRRRPAPLGARRRGRWRRCRSNTARRASA